MDFARLSGNDHLFDIAFPLTHDKLIEHLHRPNLGCHSGVLSNATIKMLVWFVATCIASVREDIGANPVQHLV